MSRLSLLLGALALATGAATGAAPALRAQAPAADSATAAPIDPQALGRREQAKFETFRRANLPTSRGSSASKCQERVGRFCYWYDESSPPPPEPEQITAARQQLIGLLDSLARLRPSDTWLSGQRVRYLDEAGRGEDALAAARECQSFGWWCDALAGFALHQLGRYAEAETAYDKVLAQLTDGERCRWNDLSLYLDDDTRQLYQRNRCGTEAREQFNQRTWWFARTRYGVPGNDSRTEHFARLTYVEFLRAAPSAYMFGFDEDERELLLRFGWSRSWSRGADSPSFGGGPPQLSIIGHDPIPAFRYIPPHHILTSPTVSDSTDWAVQLPPVVARYSPPYATRLLMLEHQQGLFRRGDTALVVLAYDVRAVPDLEGASLHGALVLTPGGEPRPFSTIVDSVGRVGRLTARAPWGPLLMSAEIAAPERATLVRARYGIRPPYAFGTRVSLSDLLFYRPYGEFPTTVEQALPHALTTQRVLASEKLGVYWEAYNTNPNGERMTISLTVVPETEEAGALVRGLRALRLARASAPVSITVEDVSARGVSRTDRAVELDISTLRPGEYLVQLEVSVAGQYTLRADRRLVVVEP